MELLLDNGVDVNSQRDFGMTPLAAATRAGLLEAVELLVNRGADTGDGSPPLISAANRNDPEIVKLLLEAGADVNITVSDSWTALKDHVAEAERHLNTAVELTRDLQAPLAA
jgi:ankyrin repeat protein